MASGTITGAFAGGSSSSHFAYKLIWSSSIYDIATRTSKVILSWYVVCDGSGWYTNKQNAGWTKTVDGTTTSGAENFNYPNPQTLVQNANTFYRSETIYVTHGIDGRKTVNISGTIDLSGTSAGNGSLSGQMVLDQIAVTPPTVNSLTYTETGTAYGAVGAYVAGFTKFTFNASATAGDTAIVSYSFYRGTELLGVVYSSLGSVTLVMQTYEPSGSWVYKVVVTDAAGNTAEKSLAAVNILPYTKPVITAVTYRCDSGGNEDNEGTYGYFDMTYTVAAVGSNAAVTAKATIQGTDYTAFPQIIGGLSIDNSYDADYLVVDKLGGQANETQTVDVSYINFELFPSSDGGGAAFGEASQNKKFIVNILESIFRGTIDASGNGSIGGDLAVTGDGVVGGDLTVTGDIAFANAIPIANGGTGQTTANGALNALGAKHIFLESAVNSSNPVTIEVGNGSTYWGGIVIGFVQAVGAVIIGLANDNGTLTARNLMTGAAWSSPALSFSVSGDQLTISSSVAATSIVSLFIG